jgi:ABC-type dipeptide/oligopeptide/nickel transport system permease subunit
MSHTTTERQKFSGPFWFIGSRLRRTAWSKYTGPRRFSMGHYVKLSYGLIGAAFFLYLAISPHGSGPLQRDRNIPANSWYWLWLPSFDATSVGLLDVEEISVPAIKSTSDLPWGTDDKGIDLRRWFGLGAQKYLLGGLIASALGVIVGFLWSLLVVWPVRPQLPYPHRISVWRKAVRFVASSLLDALDNVPKLILIFMIYASRELNVTRFTIAMAFFFSFGCASLFRNRIEAVLMSEPYTYALEFGMTPRKIFATHIVKREIAPLLWSLFPFMLSSYIVYETALSFMGWEAGSMCSWGTALFRTFSPVTAATFVNLISVFLVITSVYMLGDAMRERYCYDHA